MSFVAAFRSVGIDAPLVIDGHHGSRGICTEQKLLRHTGGWACRQTVAPIAEEGGSAGLSSRGRSRR